MLFKFFTNFLGETPNWTVKAVIAFFMGQKLRNVATSGLRHTHISVVTDKLHQKFPGIIPQSHGGVTRITLRIFDGLRLKLVAVETDVP